MLPSESRLLAGARDALRALTRDTSPATQAKLTVVDTVLTELLQRTETGFYVAHYAEGLLLAEQGAALAGAAEKPAVLPAALDPAAHAETLWNHIEALRTWLEDIVRRLAAIEAANPQRITPYLGKVVDWENQCYARIHATVDTPSESENPYTPERLQGYLREKFPDWTNLEVTGVNVLAGGFSKRTVMVDIRDEINGARSIVLRVQLPPQFHFWGGDQVEREFPVLQLMHEAGLPMAKPLWLELDKRHLGYPFLVSEKGAGENLGNHLSVKGGVSSELVSDLMRRLVQLHDTRIDPENPLVAQAHLTRWARHKTLTECTRDRMDDFVEHLRQRQVRPSPLVIRLVEWLRHNVPICDDRPSPIHADFGLHNVLTRDNKVTCILDWEYLVFSDPAEDLVPLFFHMAGVISRDEILAQYQKLSGRHVDEYRLRYWDVVYRLKFSLTCENGLRMFDQHPEADLGLCQLGFKYAYPGLASVNEKIAWAEEARRRTDSPAAG